MNDKKEPPRGLEKVCHFFLTEETSAQQDEGAYGGPSATSAGNIPLGDWERTAYGESTPSVPVETPVY